MKGGFDVGNTTVRITHNFSYPAQGKAERFSEMTKGIAAPLFHDLDCGFVVLVNVEQHSRADNRFEQYRQGQYGFAKAFV